MAQVLEAGGCESTRPLGKGPGMYDMSETVRLTSPCACPTAPCLSQIFRCYGCSLSYLDVRHYLGAANVSSAGRPKRPLERSVRLYGIVLILKAVSE
jgi:hypothetical protein